MTILLIALFLLIVGLVIMGFRLASNNKYEGFATFPGTTKVIARKKIAGTGTACPGACTDDPADALKSTFNFPVSRSYSVVSDSSGNIFVTDHANTTIRKLTKLANGNYGSSKLTITIKNPPKGVPATISSFFNIAIDSKNIIYLVCGSFIYKLSTPDSNNILTATVITPIPPAASLISNISGNPIGITSDGTNLYVASNNGLNPFVVKLSPPTSGNTWTQQRFYPSTSTTGTPVTTGLTANSTIYRGVAYAADRNELALTTHNGGTVLIMSLKSAVKSSLAKPAGASTEDTYCTTTIVNVGPSFPYGITYKSGFYYLFEAEGNHPINTIRRIKMSASPPTIENFFGPATAMNSNTLDGVSGAGGGQGSFAGCFDPDGALFIADNTHTIVMIGIDSATPESVTDITDTLRVKMSSKDDAIFKAGITSGKIMNASMPPSEKDLYLVDYDGTKNKAQSQVNPCIARNALFNVLNKGATDQCVVLDEEGTFLPVPVGKKGADACKSTQVFQQPTCYKKVGFIDYDEYDSTLEPMPMIEVDKIAQLKRRKNMLASAGQLNIPKNTGY